MKKTVVFLLMLLAGSVTFAQSKREVMRERVDSVLRKNYEKGSYDTLYIKRPDSNLEGEGQLVRQLHPCEEHSGRGRHPRQTEH